MTKARSCGDCHSIGVLVAARVKDMETKKHYRETFIQHMYSNALDVSSYVDPWCEVGQWSVE